MNEVEQLVAGRLADPHHLLGAHPHGGGVVVRAWRPEAQAVVAKPENAPPVELELRHPAGLFEGVVPDADAPLSYELEVATRTATRSRCAILTPFRRASESSICTSPARGGTSGSTSAWARTCATPRA